MTHARKQAGSWRRVWAASLTGVAVGYPGALLLTIGALRLVGDDWWVTSVALYLPRLGFALPLPFIVTALLLAKRWRLLALQAASLWLLLFPLMGLCIAWRSYPAEGQRSFRILTYNADSGNGGFDALVDEILSHSPDLVFLQELPPWRAEEMKAHLQPTYPNVLASDQFMVASKRKILSADAPPKLPFKGRDRSPRFMRFVVETPLGPVTVFSLHTVSPRGAFYRLRGSGLRHEISSGHIFSGGAAAEISDTAALRALQAQTVATLAARESGPVMIVGDSNLPTLSAARSRAFADFQDGFNEAGLGFGYSYPAKYPWMRIDLLLANSALEFKRVEVGAGRASDHRCVFGDVVARGP